MNIFFKTKIFKFAFILFAIFFTDFQKVFSDENFKELNIEYLNQKKSTKYIIGPGDILKISSIQFNLEIQDSLDSKSNPQLNNNYRIGDQNLTLMPDNYFVKGDGTINIPRFKNIFVEGLTVEELSYLLNKKYEEYFIDPDINVEVKEYRNISVYVDGEVNTPGLYILPGTIDTNNSLTNNKKIDNITLNNNIIPENLVLRRSTSTSGVFPRLYDAISTAGGITSFADLSNISIIRKNNLTNGGGKISANVDFLDIIETGSSENNIRIYDGDIIKVSKSKIDLTAQLSKAVKSNLNPRFINVIVAGRIELPGKIKINKSSSLNEAILMKGGIKPLSGRISFLRYSDEGLIDKRSFRYSQRSSKGSYKNPILKNGDVIIVGQSGLNVATKLIREITSPFIGIKAAYDILD